MGRIGKSPLTKLARAVGGTASPSWVVEGQGYTGHQHQLMAPGTTPDAVCMNRAKKEWAGCAIIPVPARLPSTQLHHALISCARYFAPPADGSITAE